MKILIADDDPVIRKQLELALAKYGYEITQCGDGMAAWEILKNEDAPSLLILDLVMPGIQGMDLCQKVRRLNKEPQPYIIILTAKNDVNDVIAGLDAGADDYIVKPFYPHELRARLKAGVRALTLQNELLKARNQLAIKATHDYLTGILNRRAVMNTLQLEIERHVRAKTPFGIALLDLDHFKKINDEHGHLAGDEVLCETAKRIRSAMRPYDSLGRYGGEEFLLILPDCDSANALGICQRIRQLIHAEPMQSGAEGISVSASIGLCMALGSTPLSMEKWVKQADDALYKAKSSGRNCVITSQFSADMPPS